MFGRGGRSGGGGRQVCHFFLEGRCRFGDSCKNEHPPGQGNTQGQGNRFAALDNNARNRSGGFGSNNTTQESNPYNVDAEMIKADLTSDRPIWPLSSYGPGKNAPLQLMEGDIEQSPEEMRVRHYLAVAKGNPQESAQLEAQTAAKANEAIQRILGDLNGAVKYIIDGKDKHPNRLDMENKGSGAQQQNAFGAPAAAPAASGFGQPSSMGQQGSAFGKPAFGQPAAQSTFGQSSAFGKPSQPGFGQASSLGGGASAFGQPSQPAQNSGFGRPSAMGGGASAFGQPSAPGQSTGFGQPSQMGQKPAFGQSTFGQPAQPAFGQAPKPAFGQASTAGQSQNNANPFGAAASQPSGFAQAAQQPATGFGQPSAFGAAANKPSPFGAAASGQTQQQFNPFANASNNTAQQQPQGNSFGAASQSAFGQPSQPAAQQNPFSTGANNTSQPAFGQPTQPTTSAFGQPSQPTTSAFGQPSQPTATKPNPFSQTQPQPQAQQAQQPKNPDGTDKPPTPFTPYTPQVLGTPQYTPTAGPDPSTYLTLNAANQPLTFKGHRVIYLHDPKHPDDPVKSRNIHVYQHPGAKNEGERLWFPQGPPPAAPGTQCDDAYYQGELGKELKAIYEDVFKQGTFSAGSIPEVPPLREWVKFDL